MSDSSIEWTEKTWNPTKGCSKVSPGCTNCYAIRMAMRLQAMDVPTYRGLTRKSGKQYQWTGKINTAPEALSLPLTWKKPAKIFVNSMSDLFHESIPVEFLKKVWDVMAEADHHQFQVLTKRPDHMNAILQDSSAFPRLPNVWLGVSVENSDHLDRLDILKEIPAYIRFVSLEPLLGPLTGINLKNIDWAIVGGESGPGSRPIEEEWVKEIESACRAAGTYFFFKQWGGRNKKQTGRTWRNQTWDEIPPSIDSWNI